MNEVNMEQRLFKHVDILGRHTFDSMPILMMLPVMVRMSLMMRRMYQPLMNSNRSAQDTFRSRVSLKKCTYSLTDNRKEDVRR